MDKKNKNPNVPNLRFSRVPYITYKMKDFTKRITRKNKDNFCNLALTISAQYGLVDQISFFNKTIASKDMSGYYLLKNGEFAYNKSYSKDYPWGTIKRLDLYDQGCLSTLYICFKCNEKYIDSSYLVHYFESPKWHKQVANIAGEGARNHGLLNIAIDDFFMTKHKIPSLEEQRKIAKFFNLIDERIQTQIKIINDYEILKNKINERIYSELEDNYIKFKDTYLRAKEGGTPSTSIPKYYNGTIPFIKIDDLTNKYISTNKSFISDSGLKNSSAWIIPTNSIILSNGATIGCVSINKYPVSTKQGILGIIPKKEILTEYLYYLINTVQFKRKLKTITTKGTIDCAYIKDIDTLKVKIPNMNLQIKIVKILSCFDIKIQIEKNLLNNLKLLKTYLLNNLFI